MGEQGDPDRAARAFDFGRSVDGSKVLASLGERALGFQELAAIDHWCPASQARGEVQARAQDRQKLQPIGKKRLLDASLARCKRTEGSGPGVSSKRCIDRRSR